MRFSDREHAGDVLDNLVRETLSDGTDGLVVDRKGVVAGKKVCLGGGR